MGNTARDELAVTAKLFRAQFASGMSQQSRPRDARGVQDERLGISSGTLAKVFIGCKKLYGGLDCLLKRHDELQVLAT
jgi:hypothetical protein